MKEQSISFHELLLWEDPVHAAKHVHVAERFLIRNMVTDSKTELTRGLLNKV